MSRVEFRKSPAKNVGLVLLGLVMVVASALAARIGDDPFIRGVGWFGVLFFGLAAVKAFRDVFSTDVAYVIDERGIDDRQSGMGLIPWTAITKVEVLSVRGTRFVLLSLDRPDAYLERVSPMKRRAAAINQNVGWGDWSLAFVGLSPGIDEAQRLIDRYYGQREGSTG